MDTIYIGLSGKKQSGKDTAFNALKNYPFPDIIYSGLKRYAFADNIRKICNLMFGLTDEQLDDKSFVTDIEWDSLKKINPEYSEKKGCLTVRELLQIMGTDIGRDLFGYDIWVKCLFRQIEHECPSVAILTDVRFMNEIKAIKKKNGLVFRITRPKLEKKVVDVHRSENELNNFNEWNDTIINSGTKQNFMKKVQKIIAPWIIGYQHVQKRGKK